MTLPIPTRAFVESQNGIYWGHFAHPIKPEESDEFFAFKPPKGQMRHEHHINGRVVVYSLKETA